MDIKITENDIDIWSAKKFLKYYIEKDSMIDVNNCISIRKFRNDLVSNENLASEGLIPIYIRNNRLSRRPYDLLNLFDDVSRIKEELKKMRKGDKITYAKSFKNEFWNEGAGDFIATHFILELFKARAIKNKHSYLAIGKYLEVVELMKDINRTADKRHKIKTNVISKIVNEGIIETKKDLLYELEKYFNEKYYEELNGLHLHLEKILKSFSVDLQDVEGYKHFISVQHQIEKLLKTNKIN